MKNIFLPFIVLTFVFSLQAQQTDWEKYELKGKVKKVEANTGFYKGRCAQTINILFIPALLLLMKKVIS